MLYLACDKKNIQHTISLINEDLSNINEWLSYSKLSLNAKKSKAMLISSRFLDTSDFHIKIKDTEIDFVRSIKYLGVPIDSTLSFNEYHQSVISKLNSQFYVLKRCIHKMNYASKQLFVKSIVFPCFNFCSTVLFLLTDGQIDSLQKVMNRFMRLILISHYRTPRQRMLDQLGWLSVKQLIMYNTLIFLHKSSIGATPYYLASQMVLRGQTQRLGTRSANEYREKPYTKQIAQNSLFYKGIQMFNQFRNFMKSQKESQKSIKSLAIDYVKLSFPLS